MYPIVPNDFRRRNTGPQDAEAGNGGEAGCQERSTGKRDQGARIQDIHGRGDGGCRRKATGQLIRIVMCSCHHRKVSWESHWVQRLIRRRDERDTMQLSNCTQRAFSTNSGNNNTRLGVAEESMFGQRPVPPPPPFFFSLRGSTSWQVPFPFRLYTPYSRASQEAPSLPSYSRLYKLCPTNVIMINSRIYWGTAPLLPNKAPQRGCIHTLLCTAV